MSRVWNLVKAILFVAVTAVGCGGDNHHDPLCQIKGSCGTYDESTVASKPPRIEYGSAAFSLTSQGFNDCSELQGLVRERLVGRQLEERRYRAWHEEQMRRWSRRGTNAKASASEDGAANDNAVAEASESMTNIQEKGVDEADTVKIGKNHIYVQQAAGVKVVDRKSYEVLGSMETSGLHDVKLYSDQDRLIITGVVHEKHEAGTLPQAQMALSDYYIPQNIVKSTEVRIYESTQGAMPKMVRSHSIRGDIVDTRLVEGRMVLVLKKQLDIDTGGVFTQTYYSWNAAWPFYTNDLDAIIPESPIKLSSDGTIDGIPCSAMIRPQSNDFDFRLTQVLMIQTRGDDHETASAALLGGGDQIYMTAESLYVAKQGLIWFHWDAPGKEELAISKFAIRVEENSIVPIGGAIISGRVKDQWAFKEYATEKTLVVASTTGQLWGQGDQIAQNHLWVLQENAETGALDLRVALRDFGTGEDIRSVRFVDRMAYVVTFKKTDPLFAFDLTNLAAPQLLGELKIPGFSTYMHPVAPGRILGVGFDALEQGDFALYQGVQVSLFDVSRPGEMVRIDQRVIGSRGSSSEVTWDHHAFFYDPESKLAAIPAIELGGGDSGWGYGNQLKFSGAVLYQVGDDLSEIGRISHAGLIPKNCLPTNGQWWEEERRSPDVNRVFKVDGNLLAISRFAITVKNYQSGLESGIWQEFDRVIDLGGSVADCASNYGYY